jgi:hypothetical protein
MGMTVDTATRPREDIVAIPAKPEALPLNDALEQVRQDSRRDPEAFLDESVVPHGGE